MAEDFRRLLEDGASRDEALEQCCREFAMPLLSSTLTTILLFISLMLVAHDAGEYTSSISLVILLSLTTSWILAMTVTPLLCYRFMKVLVEKVVTKASMFDRVEGSHGKALSFTMRHRGLFLLAIVICFGLGLYGLAHTPKNVP